VVETLVVTDTHWRAGQLQAELCQGDSVRTGARSRAALVLTTETVVRLDQLTTLTLSGVDETPTSWIDLLTGAAHFLTRTPRALKVKTPYINAAVEGTEFVVRAGPDQGDVTVMEGRVLAENSEGSVRLTSGQSAVAGANDVPALRLGVRPTDAVQWSIYYPPLLDTHALGDDTDWGPSTRRSADAYLAGDLAGAFAAIDGLPDTIADARFYNYRAGLLLAVGRVDQAQADIARSLALAPDNAHAVALQSVVALARNDNAAALDLARQAHARDAASVPAWVALSYAQQAAFDLDGARASMEQALDRNPGDALVLARLSELWLSQGDLRRALDNAQRAVAINPNVARTQIVLGFAYLTQIKIGAARQAFDRGISLDSADPLARLGRGLALIRTGKLAGGRRDIEIAAALDPNNALIRSYLGKAYYEEKRNRLTGPQLAMAKQLDPNDPTPWFYDGIRLQTENRPVEALNDIQKSIELNDNRAVYRSRLLLDEDQAMRGVSLAKTYRDLGLDPVAETEATKSITVDPANYSAHRFLSDSYVGRQRYEIARASEQLQSQLLQPVNMNPVQPQSAEAHLQLNAETGPKEAGFSEFTPLFTRNDAQLTASAMGGNYGTWSDEVALYGMQNRFSYSLGQFHYETDGYRPNNDVTHDVYTAFTQIQVADHFDVQLEYRNRKTDQGDLRSIFYSEFDYNARSVLDQGTTRLGLHFSPSVSSDVIASIAYSNRTTEYFQTFGSRLVTTTNDTSGDDVEVQYLFHPGATSGVVGAGTYRVDRDSLALRTTGNVTATLLDGGARTTQSSGYAYVTVPAGAHITTTLGMVYNTLSVNNPKHEIDKYNAKIGLQWDVNPSVRVRAAAFDTSKRDLLINQTIEPTQVAGFNQLFDDVTGTQARSYAAAMDIKAQHGIFSGVEAHLRDLEVPNLNSASLPIEYRDDDSYRAYLYWIAHPRWTFSADLQIEKLRGQYASADRTKPTQLDTTSVPLGIRYFHPNGIFAGLVTTFVRQDLEFRLSNTRTELAQGDFTVVDLTLGYRLPKRLGMLGVTVKNLFDRDFLYQDSSIFSNDSFNINPLYLPTRTIFVNAVLTF
jgi:tetratricopeptide (TPR) repeat protein